MRLNPLPTTYQIVFHLRWKCERSWHTKTGLIYRCFEVGKTFFGWLMPERFKTITSKFMYVFKTWHKFYGWHFNPKASWFTFMFLAYFVRSLFKRSKRTRKTSTNDWCFAEEKEEDKKKMRNSIGLSKRWLKIKGWKKMDSSILRHSSIERFSAFFAFCQSDFDFISNFDHNNQLHLNIHLKKKLKDVEVDKVHLSWYTDMNNLIILCMNEQIFCHF